MHLLKGSKVICRSSVKNTVFKRCVAGMVQFAVMAKVLGCYFSVIFRLTLILSATNPNLNTALHLAKYLGFSSFQFPIMLFVKLCVSTNFCCKYSGQPLSLLFSAIPTEKYGTGIAQHQSA